MTSFEDMLKAHEGRMLKKELAAALTPVQRDENETCACGRELDENGEHDGGYGAWCS